VVQHNHSPIGKNSTKEYGCDSCIFITLEINKFILLKYMCIVQKCIYTTPTVHIYILQVCISTSV